MNPGALAARRAALLLLVAGATTVFAGDLAPAGRPAAADVPVVGSPRAVAVSNSTAAPATPAGAPGCTPEQWARHQCGGNTAATAVDAAGAPIPSGAGAAPAPAPPRTAPVMQQGGLPARSSRPPAAGGAPPGAPPGAPASGPIFGGIVPLGGPGLPALRGSLPSREPEQLLVFWPDAEAAARDLAGIERDFGLTPAERSELGSLGGTLALFRTGGREDLTALRSRLREAVPQATVDFNSRYYPQAGPRQYFAAHVGFPAREGPAVPIGIVDGEVEAIPALAEARIVRRGFLAAAERPAAGLHATAVACLIACRDAERAFAGAAPAAPLYAASIMRRIGGQDSTTTLLLAKALDWLVAQRVRVINLSLGGPRDEVMARLFERLLRLPLAVFAAAGNGGPGAPPSYPAAYAGVIAVTATNAADAIYAKATPGDYVALAAPGEDLWVPLPDGGRYVSGTSYATALASGAAARVLVLRPNWDAAALRRHLCFHARDLGDPGPDPVFGCGRIRVGDALDSLAPASATGKQ